MWFVDVDECGSNAYMGQCSDVYLHGGANNAV